MSKICPKCNGNSVTEDGAYYVCSCNFRWEMTESERDAKLELLYKRKEILEKIIEIENKDIEDNDQKPQNFDHLD